MDLLLVMRDLGVAPPAAGDTGDERCRRALAREFDRAAKADTSTGRARGVRRNALTRVRRSPKPRLRTRRRHVVGAGLAAAAAMVAAIAVVGSPGPSIVARAYAATDPTAVIVHYAETSTTWLHGRQVDVSTMEVWSYGGRSHEILRPSDAKSRQDIVASDGHVYTLVDGVLMTSLYSPSGQQCSAAGILAGCVLGQNEGPLAALRVLYRRGEMRLTGNTTLDGRRLNVLAGRSRDLGIHALVDQRTFAPVKITMTDTSSQAGRSASITHTLTITDYQRLPVTGRALRRLGLPPHPHVRLIRNFPCRELYPGCAATRHAGS